MPHVPEWLASVVDIVVARYEAEAVFLIGSQARGDARSGSDYNLLAIVEIDRLGTPRPVVEERRAALEGFAAPVTVLAAALAELMAGIYAGHPLWIRLAREAHPLFDPASMHGLLERRLADAPVSASPPNGG